MSLDSQNWFFVLWKYCMPTFQSIRDQPPVNVTCKMLAVIPTRPTAKEMTWPQLLKESTQEVSISQEVNVGKMQ